MFSDAPIACSIALPNLSGSGKRVVSLPEDNLTNIGRSRKYCTVTVTSRHLLSDVPTGSGFALFKLAYSSTARAWDKIFSHPAVGFRWIAIKSSTRKTLLTPGMARIFSIEAGQSPLLSFVYVIATPFASLSSKFNFILFGLGVVSIDSSFTFALPVLYPVHNAHVCEIRPHFTIRLRLSLVHQALRQVCEVRWISTPLTAAAHSRKR